MLNVHGVSSSLLVELKKQVRGSNIDLVALRSSLRYIPSEQNASLIGYMPKFKEMDPRPRFFEIGCTAEEISPALMIAHFGFKFWATYAA